MPENQSQPRNGGVDSPAGGPRLSPQPDAPSPDRPSDTEAVHVGEDGSAARDPRMPHVEPPSFSSGERATGESSHDYREDYGDVSANQGTDAHTAGAEFAERLPKASSTPEEETGRG